MDTEEHFWARVNLKSHLAHLARRYELKGSESGFHIGNVGFEVVEGGRDACLRLIRMLPRRARRCNLV